MVKKVLVATFEDMSVSIPMKDNETIEEVENRMIEAVDSIGDHVAMSYKLVVKEYDD